MGDRTMRTLEADVEMIKPHSLDKSDMCNILMNFPEQYQKACRMAWELVLPQAYKNVKNIVISGMGGSAMGGDLVRSLFSNVCPVPIVVNRNYSVPGFVNEDTLFMAVSYSGNTEETLAAFGAAINKKAKVLSISTGGALGVSSKVANIPYFSIPMRGVQPRCAFGYIFTPIMVFLSQLGFIPGNIGEVEAAVTLLCDTSRKLNPDVPFADNEAKQIAEAIYDKLPVVYASQSYFDSVAMRWKGQFNENSQIMAFYNVIPEMNHNEIVGWDMPKAITSQCVAIFLCNDANSESIKKRFSISKDLISGETQTITVQALGDSLLSRALYLIYLGDFVSYYLAILNGVDPTPIARIDFFKEQLGIW